MATDNPHGLHTTFPSRRGTVWEQAPPKICHTMARNMHASAGSVQKQVGKAGKLVLRERIELSTSPLPRECSTTELPQQPWRAFCHTRWECKTICRLPFRAKTAW